MSKMQPLSAGPDLSGFILKSTHISIPIDSTGEPAGPYRHNTVTAAVHLHDDQQELGVRAQVHVAGGRAFVYDAASAATLLSDHRIWATPVGVRHVA